MGRVAFGVGALALFVLSMSLRLGPELADDGAFFLRYAENILRGEFWVWNPGEAPVWGASAPLYPFVVALPMALGIAPVPALIGTGMALMATALTLTGVVLREHFGWMAGLAFVTLAAFDTGLMYFGGAGLESPLTLLLMAVAVWAVVARVGGVAVGTIAGLLMVHKLDLVPAGGLLLVATWLRDRRPPLKAAVVATLIGTCWYAFAWFQFGLPVPNSFLTKFLHQDALPRIIDWRWFGNYVLFAGFHRWLLFLAPLAFVFGSTLRPLAVLLFGVVAVHLLAYTSSPPFEPYNWYGMPSVFALLVLAAIGIRAIEVIIRGRVRGWLVPLYGPAVLVTVLVSGFWQEWRNTTSIKQFSSYQEADRSDAGRWVNANVPSSFRVYTMWGNPAYYAHRPVFDGSFLNRRFEEGSLLDRYKPEIAILQANPGVQPLEPVFPGATDKGYEVVKVFAKSHSIGLDYFFAVLARRDVINAISGRETSINPLRYVRNVRLGDEFGRLEARGLGLFVHPGATTSTRFDLDVAAIAKDTGKQTFDLEARMAPNVPDDAVRRGAANVKLVVSDGHTVAEAVVTVGQSYRAPLGAAAGGQYQLTVDANGDADTDWLLLFIR